MAKTESFDISTGVDLQEVDNAINQARKELSNRFDFKGALADIVFDRAVPNLTIHTEDDFKLEALWEVLRQRFISRKVALENLRRGNVEKAAGSTVRQTISITQSIDTETARKIVKFIKEKKYKKIQSAIQGDEVRVSAPSRDELQTAIQDLKDQDWGMELKFGNYR